MTKTHICPENDTMGTLSESYLVQDDVEEKWHLIVDCHGAELFDINFCPFCGKNLNEGETNEADI